MKTILAILAILILTIFTFSCSKDDNNSGSAPTPTADYFFKAKIDGVQYEAVAPRILAGKTANRITITSVLPDLRNFEIIIDDYPSNPIGTYTIPATSGTTGSASLRFGDGTSSSSIFSAGSCCDLDCAIGTRGTIEITAISATEISGTFSFTGTKTSGTCPRLKKIITEGSFKSGITQ